MKTYYKTLTTFLTVLLLLFCGVGQAQTLNLIGSVTDDLNSITLPTDWGSSISIDGDNIAVSAAGEPVFITSFTDTTYIAPPFGLIANGFGDHVGMSTISDSTLYYLDGGVSSINWINPQSFNSLIFSNCQNYIVYNDSVIAAYTPTPVFEMDFWVDNGNGFNQLSNKLTALGQTSLDISDNGLMVVGDMFFNSTATGNVSDVSEGRVFLLDLKNPTTINDALAFNNNVIVGEGNDELVGASVAISPDGNTVAATSQSGLIIARNIGGTWSITDTLTTVNNIVDLTNNYLVAKKPTILPVFPPTPQPEALIYELASMSAVDSVSTSDGSDIKAVAIENSNVVISSNTGIWMYELTCPNLSTPSVIPVTNVICSSGDSTQLSTTPNTDVISYTWALNGQVQAITDTAEFYVSDGGNWAVTIQNACGDVATSSPILISEVSSVKPIIIPSDTLACDGTTVMFSIANLQTSDSYEWSLNGSLDGSGSTYSTVVAGTIQVDATNACGTISSEPVVVNYESPLTQPILENSDTTVCESNGLNIELVSNTSVVWLLDGDSVGVGNTFTATEIGEYTAERTNVCGTESATVIIENTTPEIPTITQNGTTLSASGNADSYIWITNGDTLTETGNTLNNPIEGSTYQVIAVSAEGCESEISDSLVYSTVSRSERMNTQIRVYPNPTSGALNIDSSLPIDNVSVRSVSGQTVYNGTSAQLKLSTGLYLVTVRSGDAYDTFKVVVQ